MSFLVKCTIVISNPLILIKACFLASDIASFEQYRDDFDNAITTGKLDFTFDIFNLSLKRRFERYEYSLDFT